MEKDIGKIPKNAMTDIVIRVDDFAGRAGVTIREFSSGDRYTGFTKSGTKIPAEKFEEFKKLINSITPEDMAEAQEAAKNAPPATGKWAPRGAEKKEDAPQQEELVAEDSY